MSVIHSSWVLLGRSSAPSRGSARKSTLKSIADSRVGKASTASPAHWRRVAAGAFAAVSVIVSPFEEMPGSQRGCPARCHAVWRDLHVAGGHLRSADRLLTLAGSCGGLTGWPGHRGGCGPRAAPATGLGLPHAFRRARPAGRVDERRRAGHGARAEGSGAAGGSAGARGPAGVRGPAGR